MTAATTDRRYQTGGTPLRMLVAVHGYEPGGWAQETCRVVSTWVGSSIRVLAVLDVPCPPLTSLTPFAKRAYNAARAGWAELEAIRLQGALDALLPGLPGHAEVVREPATRGDLARTIAEHARTWPADVVVVGGPPASLRSWLRPGPVHERVLRHAGCTVLVPTSPVVATPKTRLAVIRTAAAARGTA
jgi:nucleotide-binding universal stress UspA family protein